MTNLKAYNPSLSKWENVSTGIMGPTGPPGIQGPGGEVVFSPDPPADTTKLWSDTDEVAGQTPAMPVNRWRTNYWIGSPNSAVSVGTMGEGVLSVSGLLIPPGLALTEMAVESTIAGSVGALIRMGIYELTGVGTGSTLIQDAGAADGTVLGVVSRPLTIPARATSWYALLSMVVQGGATTRPQSRIATGLVQEAPFMRATLNTSLFSILGFGGYIATSVSGALPASSATVSEGGGPPRIFVRGTQS